MGALPAATPDWNLVYATDTFVNFGDDDCLFLNHAVVMEDRLARLYKRPASTYVDLYNEISPAWRCIKRPLTSVSDGYRVPGRHRLEYRVLARAVVSPGNAFNCRLYLFRSRMALKGLDTLDRIRLFSQITNTQTGDTVTVRVVQTSR